MVLSLFMANRSLGRYRALQLAISAERARHGLVPLVPLRNEPPQQIVAELRAKGFAPTEIAIIGGVIEQAGAVRFMARLRTISRPLYDKCRTAMAVATAS